MTHCLTTFGLSTFLQDGSVRKFYATLENIDLILEQIRIHCLKYSFFSLNAMVCRALLYKKISQVHMNHEMIFQVLFYLPLYAEGHSYLDNF